MLSSMAEYKCPRCFAPVQRAQTGAVAHHFGLVGALIGMAFSGFACAKCGPIPKKEFTLEEQSLMGRGSAMLVVGGVVVLAAAIGVLIALS